MLRLELRHFNQEMFIVSLGNLDNPKSIGTNKLIKEGAKLVTSPEDIVINYSFLHKVNQTNNNIIYDLEDVSEEYRDIYHIIKNEPLDINDIVKLSKTPLKEVMSKLTMLELDGKIKKISGNRYVRKD